ncbi:hypothetical protein ZWY2020_005388 [Hordeum vulgare]|nr:hypothetical protein ZWY2020_005388 [Hordeum vulgare]
MAAPKSPPSQSSHPESIRHDSAIPPWTRPPVHRGRRSSRSHDADGNSERSDHVAAFVELVTEGTVAWARVGFWLVDQTTGETVPLFREKDQILFDASSEDTCTWGTGEVARRSHLHAGSRYVLGDRLKIECAIDVCGDFLTFDDPLPTPSSGLPLF